MVQLYRGSGLSFMATDLHPEFSYSFEVAAVNSAGESEYVNMDMFRRLFL